MSKRWVKIWGVYTQLILFLQKWCQAVLSFWRSWLVFSQLSFSVCSSNDLLLTGLSLFWHHSGHHSLKQVVHGRIYIIGLVLILPSDWLRRVFCLGFAVAVLRAVSFPALVWTILPMPVISAEIKEWLELGGIFENATFFEKKTRKEELTDNLDKLSHHQGSGHHKFCDNCVTILRQQKCALWPRRGRPSRWEIIKEEYKKEVSSLGMRSSQGSWPYKTK